MADDPNSATPPESKPEAEKPEPKVNIEEEMKRKMDETVDSLLEEKII